MTAQRIRLPFPRAQRLLALTIGFVTAFAVFSDILHPRQADFLAFWAAARLAITGHAVAAYDPAAVAAVQATVTRFDHQLPFGYPPPFLLLLLPLGALPSAWAFATWVVATGGAYLAAANRLVPGGGWFAAAFPPIVVSGIIGQNGLLTAAIAMGVTILLPRRPFIAGLCVGCLVIKPHLAPLYPLAFLAGKQWRAIAGAALSSLLLSLLALAVFGSASYVAMVHEAPFFANMVRQGSSVWYKMASVYSALRLAGMAEDPAWICHILVALMGAAVTIHIWRGPHELFAKMAVLVAATLLVSPYLFVYDTPMLVIPLLWLARDGADPRGLALLWLLPLATIAQNWSSVHWPNPMPLLTILILLWIVRRLTAGTARPALAWPAAQPAQ